LGVIFYEMLIGEIPWRAADPDSQYLAILTTKITIKKSFICELSQQLITKTLAVPEKKRASWAELADLLSLDKSLASTFVSSARDDELILFRQLSEFVIA
jgi:serine/threonine protein kinase